MTINRIWPMLLAAGLSALAAMPAMAQEANLQECVTDYRPDVDLFPVKVSPQYSKSWDISYHGNFKVITVHNSLVENSVSYKYVLVQCGTPAPGLAGELADAQVIEVPVHRVTVAATGIYPLEALGVLDTLVGWGSSRLSQDTPYINRIKKETGAVSLGDLDAGSFDIEATLNADLDMAFVWLEYGDFLKQGKNMGLPVVYSPANYESNAMAAAETIEFTAAFYNLEGKANQFMSDLETGMAETRKATATVNLKGSFGHIYLDPSDFMRPHSRTYPRVGLIESLGLTNVFGDIPMANDFGSMGVVDYEGALAHIKDDTILIFGASGDELRAQMARDDRYATLAPFKDPAHKVWVYIDPRSIDFQCDAMLHFRPDILLKDYAIAFAPDLFPGAKTTCYEPLGPLQQ